MPMSQDAKDRTAKALAGKTIKSVRWEADPDGSNGYWVMTFDDDSEICWNRMQAEVAMAPGIIPTRPRTPPEVSDEREFGGESPELIHLRHAAHEFSEASSADVSAMRTVGRGAETAHIRKPFVERMQRADRALAAAAKAYAAVGDDPKPSDQ